MTNHQEIHQLIETHRKIIITEWIDEVISTVDSPRDAEEQDCIQLLSLIGDCLLISPVEIDQTDSFKLLKDALRSFSAFRALNEYTPTQTANYLLLLKKVIYTLSLRESSDIPLKLLLEFNDFIDRLAVMTFQYFSESREEVILSQTYALEHDTPIVKILSLIHI